MNAPTPDTAARHYVSPHFHAPGDGDTRRDVTNPSTLATVGARQVTGADTTARVLGVANRAQRDWAALDAKTRATYLHAVAYSIDTTDPERASVLLTSEMGKPYPESVGEIANCGGVFRYYAEMARDDAGHVAGTTQAGSFQYAVHEPYGVSVHILPFNFPILLMCWTVAASLAAGNACIVKPAEATTLSTLEFMRHFDGLPPGLVCCLPGDADTARGLVDSPDTHAVAFTGSVAAGRAVAEACGRQLKPCLVEAGGSDPMIVTATAPLDIAAAGCVTAAFHLSGQICTSAERFFVVDALHDAFVERFVARTLALRVGDGMGRHEIGPLVSEAGRDKVAALVEEAVAAGARIACGGRIPEKAATGWYYEPTILVDVTPDMRIVRVECFGPVASVCRVADLDEAIALANDSAFGLGASIFTTDLEEAMRATRELAHGMVWVNNPLIDNDALPFGGWRRSGVGRELGRAGLDAFRQSRMVVVDHVPRLHEWWYPYPDEWFHDAGGRKLS